MTRKYRMIQVGTGGQGNAWCARFVPSNIADGRIEVVAAVDINPEVHINAQQHLGLPPDKCYTDIEPAFDENRADFCSVVVPPAFHEAVVDIALAHDMHIISEKPIADTMAGSVRIAAKVKRAGKKMGVTMSHRFDQDKTTLRHALRTGRPGAIDYLVCRFTCGLRNFGDWGAHFRHTMEEALMIEGAVHHLDIIADLAGSNCDTLYAQTWNPSWGEYGSGSQGHVMMTFENGVRAIYEGAKTNASGFNGWAKEYVRAECEHETLIMDNRRIERFPYQPKQYSREGRRRGDPPARAVQMEERVADCPVSRLAGRRPADGDERRGQSAVGRPDFCRHREQPQRPACQGAGVPAPGMGGRDEW